MRRAVLILMLLRAVTVGAQGNTPEDSVRATEMARRRALLSADNTGAYKGFPFAGKIRYTRVFVRREGRWQAVSMQQTAMQ